MKSGMTSYNSHHKGFGIWYDGRKWCAERYGVTVNAQTFQAVLVVIDNHIADNEAWRKRFNNADRCAECGAPETADCGHR